MTTTVQIGKGLSIDVDFAAMPQVARDHVLYIGARNILMDAHASITKDEYPDETVRAGAALAVAEKKLAALMSGEVRTASARESVDPVRAEAIKMARAIVTARIKTAGKKVSDFEPAAIKAACDKVIAADASIMETARKRVEENKAATPATTDLADLDL